MRTALLLLLAFAAPAYASQTVWKWVDDQGVTHYSDRAVPGAIKMELSVGNRSDSGATPSATPASPTPAEPASGPAYRNFEILAPQRDETIINTGGRLTVNILIDPALSPGHSLNLYLDGKLIEGFPPNTTSYDLTEVPRGVHWVVARVNDRRSNRVQETERVTFTVRQTSIAQPPVGPALRPPPKPPRRPGGGAN